MLATNRLVTQVKQGGSFVRDREHAAASAGTRYAEPWSGPTLQCFSSPEAAQEHLECVVRLRKREGYERRENEITDEEAVHLINEATDPIAALVHLRPERGLVDISFDHGPVSPAACLEVVARVMGAAPAGIDYVRRGDIPGGHLGAALAGQALPSVKSLVHTVQAADGGRWSEALNDVAVLISAFPNLERVFAKGRFALSRPSHDRLRELYLCSEAFSPASLMALARAALPALATLGLSLKGSPLLARTAATALTGGSLPRLRAVMVTGLTEVTPFLANLVRRWPASWESLHLQGSVGDEDELLAVLGERAPALRSLSALGLPLSNHVSEGAIAKAKALVPSLVDTSELPDLLSLDRIEAWQPARGAA